MVADQIMVPYKKTQVCIYKFNEHFNMGKGSLFEVMI